MKVVSMSSRGPSFHVTGGLIALAVVVVLAIIALFSSFYTVAPQEEGIVLRFGRLAKTTGPGLHFKMPFGIDRVRKVPVATVDVEEFGYRSRREMQTGRYQGEAPKAQRRGYEEESTMLTGDLNIVQVGWDVQFRRAEPAKYLFQVHEPLKTLRDVSQSVMRQVIGDRASIQVLTVERGEIQVETKTAIQKAIDDFDMGLQVVEVNLLFVEPPAEVIDSFHDLNKAEQDAQRFFEEASREYEERVPRARGTATRTIQESEGYRERRVNLAQGEADRFRSVLEEYRKAPEVTRRRMYLETLEDVLPSMKEVIVVDPNGGTRPLPLLDLRQPAAPAAKGGER